MSKYFRLAICAITVAAFGMVPSCFAQGTSPGVLQPGEMLGNPGASPGLAVPCSACSLSTSLTIGGASIGTNALSVNGTIAASGLTLTANPLGLASGGTNTSLTASNGGIVYSTASALAVLPGTVTAAQCLLSGSNAPPTWGSCSGAAAVSAVSNSDGSLTISPTTGSVVASLNVANANTWTATQTINPTANSYNRGFSITQSSPTSGSQAGPFSYNLVTINDQSDITGSAGTTQTSGLRINFTEGGANANGQPKIGAYFNMIESISGVTNSFDKVGAVGSCLIQISDTGGGCYGLNGFASVQSSGSIGRLVGIEVDVGGTSGSTITNRYGFNSTNLGVIQGSTLDAAYLVTNFTGSGGAWKAAFELSTTLGFAPLSTSGDVMTADVAMTVNNFLDFPSMTVSSYILRFPAVSLTGAGALTLGLVGTAVGSVTFIGSVSGSFTLQASGTGVPTMIGVPPSAGTDPLCYNTGNSLLTWATACAASDERLKTNFGIAPGLETALCMNGVTFDWRDVRQAQQKADRSV